MCSVCLSVFEWKDVKNFVSISNILFSSLVNSTANCGPLSGIMLSGNLHSFYILSLNNFASFSAIVVAIKCAILDNLLYTTKITSFTTTTNSNFMIKSTIRCVHGFFDTSFVINFPTGVSVLFFIL